MIISKSLLIIIIEEKSHGLVFTSPLYIETLTRRGLFTFMDFIRNTNFLKWYLYIVIIRDECSSWVPSACILTTREDSDIVAADLKKLKKWYRGRWLLYYIFTDDSAGE